MTIRYDLKPRGNGATELFRDGVKVDGPLVFDSPRRDHAAMVHYWGVRQHDCDVYVNFGSWKVVRI